VKVLQDVEHRDDIESADPRIEGSVRCVTLKGHHAQGHQLLDPTTVGFDRAAFPSAWDLGQELAVKCADVENAARSSPRQMPEYKIPGNMLVAWVLPSIRGHFQVEPFEILVRRGWVSEHELARTASIQPLRSLTYLELSFELGLSVAAGRSTPAQVAAGCASTWAACGLMSC
jgi:hypothetical protein